MCVQRGRADEGTKGQDGDLSSRSQDTAVKESNRDEQMQREPKTGLRDLDDKGKPLSAESSVSTAGSCGRETLVGTLQHR